MTPPTPSEGPRGIPQKRPVSLVRSLDMVETMEMAQRGGQGGYGPHPGMALPQMHQGPPHPGPPHQGPHPQHPGGPLMPHEHMVGPRMLQGGPGSPKPDPLRGMAVSQQQEMDRRSAYDMNYEISV